MRFDPLLFAALPVVLFSVIVHECAHGLMALSCGDTTARDRGRLTLNPLPHIDPIGSIVLPAVLLLTHAPFLFGWAKPVPINWANLRRPKHDAVKVALAGPASNLLLALLFAMLVRLAPDSGFWAPLQTKAVGGVVWNCALALFNLIPIPPLDGSWVIMRFLSMRHIIALQQFRLVGFALIIVLLNVPMFHGLFTLPLQALVKAMLRLFGTPVGAGAL